MKTRKSHLTVRGSRRARFTPPCWLAALGCATLPASGAHDLATNLTYQAELGLKETYDSNVYLQDNDPDPANVAAAKAAGLDPVEANKSSWITTILPKVGLDYKPCEAFKLSVAYAPEIAFYESAHSEDYVTHRGTFNFGGKLGEAAWDLANLAAYIDGNTESPTYARPNDIPAIGGIPLRDRRAAFIFKNTFRVTEPLGDAWFLRPVASSYVHDFKTNLRANPAPAEYLYSNYIDRQDISGGLDLGYNLSQDVQLIAGYRYGQQQQYKGPYGPGGAIIDSPYGNAYHRVLVGVEGSPASWLKLAVLFGPDIRQFFDEERLGQMYPSFDPNEFLYYWDASVTFLPTKDDTITLRSTRYEQPAFCSFSMYEDIKTDLLWRHKFSTAFTAGAGFTLYIGDWQAPANRDDWIYTPTASLTYTFAKHFTAEAVYSYDWVDSNVSAYEFTRHLATVGVKYVF